jgi:methyl-accepting chemotaxis protein
MNRILRNASIGLKISLPPALAMLGLIFVASLGMSNNHRTASAMSDLDTINVTQLAKANEISQHLMQLTQKVYQSLTWEAIGWRPEQIKALDDALQKDLAAFPKSVDAAAADPNIPADQRTTISRLAKGVHAFAKVAADTIDMKSAGVVNAASYVTSLDELDRANQQLVSAYIQSQLASTHASVSSAKAGVLRQGWIVAGVAFVVLFVCVGLSWQIVRAIIEPLGRAAQLAASLADGDLRSRQLDAGKDATGRVLSALDEVARNLTTLVSDIQQTADQISTASTEIALGNADLSVRTEGSAAALQNAASSIDQLSATIGASADNARDANQLASEAARVAREGGAMVADVVSTMGAINARARKIAEINGVIDSIAFQTNILALNAAVEAARAGEQGRGFAVVAAEVRSLAKRSADAALEIRALIQSSVEEITSGADKAEATGATMSRIVEAIEQVAQTVAGISSATAEQAAGIVQVNEMVSAMERNTQQNAAMVEQASAATESLNSQARNLVQLLKHFRVA